MNTLLAMALACLLVSPVLAATVDLDAPGLAEGVPAATIINLDVTAGTSGAPNGFTIQWMTLAQFDAISDVWPADENDPLIQSAIFLGDPTLNTVDGTRSFLLAPGGVASIQIGDVFDETGVLATNMNEVAAGTDFVIRVRANGDGGLTSGGTGLLPSSPYSLTTYCHSKPHDDDHDCVHSQGYWKEHPAAWPVSTLKLGNVIYTKTQLLAILNKSANGNGLISLAHQLIATKLNIAAGAVAPSVILGAITTADALIGIKIVPPVGTGSIAPKTTSHLTDDFEEFNDDEMEHPNCKAATDTRPRTWGELKAMYR